MTDADEGAYVKIVAALSVAHDFAKQIGPRGEELRLEIDALYKALLPLIAHKAAEVKAECARLYDEEMALALKIIDEKVQQGLILNIPKAL